MEKQEIISDIKDNWTEIIDKFEDLNLKPDLQRAVFDYGYEKPSII